MTKSPVATSEEESAVSIAPGAWREVALSDEEYERIVDLLGREPRPVELGMFGAMWSEHCGYKHSANHLRTLPTEAPWVLQGPGENAGAIDVGDGLAVVFKVESHNHPSAVEPYQGAATGVGGIVRDIFTMGARPVAVLDSLRFGPLNRPRNRYLLNNVVAGIGGYGNSLGIPTVGGEIFFDASYDGNPIVNAMCAGVTTHGNLMRARASGPGNILMLIGADTGRDGLHGATFASVDDPEASHRGVIQVGNPFLEKLLLEACLELLEGEDVVAMQDLGAAGLTSSVVECASRGGVGAEIDVARVPRRDQGMSAYEVMLSESQERMLLVVRPRGVGRVREIVERWSLHASEIGTVTDDGHVRVRDGGHIAAEVPAELFTDACPRYDRPASESEAVFRARASDPRSVPDISPEQILPTLLKLLTSPNIGSRRSVYEQYDHTIMTNTVVEPGAGDAAVIRLKGTKRGIALAIDCNSRYCWLDPNLGTRHAVAEAARNVSCAGGRPLAATNCLNFGNPEKPGGAYQLREAVAGLGAACRALGIPVVSGNVSLYNETAASPIMPTPTVGVVGVLDDVSHHAAISWSSGDEIFLLGAGLPSLGGSEILSRVHGKVIGAPPALDLEAERSLQELVQRLISEGVTHCAHDVSLGGIAVALAEMAIQSRIGFEMDTGFSQSGAGRHDVWWFGESATRVIVAAAKKQSGLILDRCRSVGIPAVYLGVAGGTALSFPGLGDILVDDATEKFEAALEPGE